MQDQGRLGDTGQMAGTGSPGVIIFDPGEAVLRRGQRIVHGAHRGEAGKLRLGQTIEVGLGEVRVAHAGQQVIAVNAR